MSPKRFVAQASTLCAAHLDERDPEVRQPRRVSPALGCQASPPNGQPTFAVQLPSVSNLQVLGPSIAAGLHVLLSVLHFLGHWALAVSGFIAAVAAAVALWFNALPFCDVYNVRTERDGGSVHLICGIKNTGNGPAFRVTIWLLDYGGLTGGDFDEEHYIAPLGPGEHYMGPNPLPPHNDRLFRSAAVSLGGRKPNEPGRVEDAPFRVLLRWEAMFWTYGESYVEEHFPPKTTRPRIKVVYPWERAWRKWRGYDWKGRH